MTKRLTFLVFAGATFAARGPAHAQHLGGGVGPDVSLIRILAAFLLCGAAAVALALVVRQRAGGSKRSARLSLTRLFPTGLTGARRIDVIEARRISLHADLCLVRCDGTEYLLLCGASGHEILARQDMPSTSGGDSDA